MLREYSKRDYFPLLDLDLELELVHDHCLCILVLNLMITDFNNIF